MADRLVAPDTQFLKVKTSKNETYFVTCRPRDTIRYVKAALRLMSGVPAEEMKLYLRNRLLEDDSSLYDQQVGDGCVIYLVSKKPAGDWENISTFLASKEEHSMFGKSLDSPGKTIT
jgi:Ubiquitin family